MKRSQTDERTAIQEAFRSFEEHVKVEGDSAFSIRMALQELWRSAYHTGYMHGCQDETWAEMKRRDRRDAAAKAAKKKDLPE